MDEHVLSFMREVGALARALHTVGESVAATAGLTHTRLACLREVADEPRTVAQVAARLGVARQGVQRTADGLAADGLAAFAANPRDRRAQLLAPTGAGRRALATAAAAHAEWVARAGTLLGDDLPDLTARLRAVRDTVTR